MRKSKPNYITVQPFPLNTAPVLEAFVLVKVYVDVDGNTVTAPINSNDVKPKVGPAQSRGALHYKHLVDEDHRRQNWGNGYQGATPSGLLTRTGSPILIDHATGLETHWPVSGHICVPIAKIQWWIYKLGASGMSFVRVAYQYP